MVSYKVPEYQKKRKRKEVKEREKIRKLKRNCFPVCIGRFPECENYNKEMAFEERTECHNCPYNGRK